MYWPPPTGKRAVSTTSGTPATTASSGLTTTPMPRAPSRRRNPCWRACSLAPTWRRMTRTWWSAGPVPSSAGSIPRRPRSNSSGSATERWRDGARTRRPCRREVAAAADQRSGAHQGRPVFWWVANGSAIPSLLLESGHSHPRPQEYTMDFPKIGNMAPAFTLLNQRGEKVALKDFRGNSNVVLYFYPKAMTPGCTTQACGIRDSKAAFAKLDTVVLGVSPDPFKRLAKFEERDQLNFDLLSDEDHALADKYGVWGPKKFMGREFDGIHRVTFIIGKDGRLKHIMAKVNTKTHHQDVQDWIRDNL